MNQCWIWSGPCKIFPFENFLCWMADFTGSILSPISYYESIYSSPYHHRWIDSCIILVDRGTNECNWRYSSEILVLYWELNMTILSYVEQKIYLFLCAAFMVNWLENVEMCLWIILLRNFLLHYNTVNILWIICMI